MKRAKNDSNGNGNDNDNSDGNGNGNNSSKKRKSASIISPLASAADAKQKVKREKIEDLRRQNDKLEQDEQDVDQTSVVDRLQTENDKHQTRIRQLEAEIALLKK